MEAFSESQLRTWVSEHNVLAGALRRAIEGADLGLTADELCDEGSCGLGQVLADAGARLAGVPQAARVAALHAAFHETAAQTLARAQAGDIAGARSAFGYAGNLTRVRTSLARSLAELQRLLEHDPGLLAGDGDEPAAGDELDPTLALVLAALGPEDGDLHVWGDAVEQRITVLLGLESLERQLLGEADPHLDRLRDTLQALRFSPDSGRLSVELTSMGHGHDAPLQLVVRLAA